MTEYLSRYFYSEGLDEKIYHCSETDSGSVRWTELRWDRFQMHIFVITEEYSIGTTKGIS